VTEQKGAVWSDTFRVRAYEVDASGRASLPAVCNWLQETTGNHASALGWGVDDLQTQGLTWVLSRFHLQLERRPGWREEVAVTTWPAGVQRLFALREFRISSGADGGLGVATTAWLLVNVCRLKPVRLPVVLEEIARGAPGRVLDDAFAKLPELTNAEFEVAIDVRYADLDMNHHANNVSLIAAALEPLPQNVVLGRSLAELEIEFRGEALHGDRLLAQAQGEGGEGWRFLHRLVREGDGREIARARTAWAGDP
jgi:medium-chain acyl-[acyl-carrier-protein] hydrolase